MLRQFAAGAIVFPHICKGLHCAICQWGRKKVEEELTEYGRVGSVPRVLTTHTDKSPQR